VSADLSAINAQVHRIANFLEEIVHRLPPPLQLTPNEQRAAAGLRSIEAQCVAPKLIGLSPVDTVEALTDAERWRWLRANWLQFRIHTDPTDPAALDAAVDKARGAPT
jgi:hypothetical protein